MSPPFRLRRLFILWLPLFAVGAFLFAHGILAGADWLADLGVFLVAGIGAPGLILDRPHPTH